MPIQPTNKDISTRGITTASLSDFSGRDRQVVIHIDDPKGYRPIIMDGQTVGGKTKVVIEKDLEEYAKKGEVPQDAATKAELQAAVEDLQEQISEPNPDWGTVGAVEDDNIVQVSMLKVSNTTLPTYAGVNAQLVYNTDTKRFIVMDGATQGGLGEVATLDDLAEIDLSDYATKAELADKAPLENPALTGIPTAPTAAKGTSTTQIATTAFVQAAMGDVQDNTAQAILQAFQDFADEHGITIPTDDSGTDSGETSGTETTGG